MSDEEPPRRIVRSARVRIWDEGSSTTVLGSDGAVRRFDGDSAALCRAVLDHLAHARTRDEVLAWLVTLAGETPQTATVLDALLIQLRAAGVVTDAGAQVRSPPGVSPTRVVLGLTGSVASAHAPVLVGALQQRGMAVRVAVTRRALDFVRARVLGALTHAPVATKLWGAADQPAAHVALAEWADLVLVAPASATTLARIATGMYTDPVSATAGLARGEGLPVVLAPSMNPGMYASPPVQRTLETLRTDGFHLVHPARGVEVADAPATRRPVVGPAPPAEDLVAVVDAVRAVTRRTRGPTQPADWEALYAGGDPYGLPWSTPAADPSLCNALDALATPVGGAGRSFLDVGTGTGTAAREAATRGYTVLATDVSPTALALAEAEAVAQRVRVTWLQDDILATRITGVFDVVHDRGCMHALPVGRHGDYAAAVAGLCAPGGWLLLTTHAADERGAVGTTGYTAAEIATLFGRWFTLERSTAVAFTGANGVRRRGLHCALRRR